MKPWGDKITLSIYVERGSVAADQLAIMAAKGVERELRETYDPAIEFIGAAVAPVEEKPYDQGAHG